MLKNSEKVIIDGGMYVFVITSVSVRCGILAQMKCLKVIKKINRKCLRQKIKIRATSVEQKNYWPWYGVEKQKIPSSVYSEAIITKIGSVKRQDKEAYMCV